MQGKRRNPVADDFDASIGSNAFRCESRLKIGGTAQPPPSLSLIMNSLILVASVQLTRRALLARVGQVMTPLIYTNPHLKRTLRDSLPITQ